MSTNFEWLNAYEIVDTNALRWKVRLYSIVRKDGQPLTHEQRGKSRDLLWMLRKENVALCRGYGFVIDVAENMVVIPDSWRLPDFMSKGEYEVRLNDELTTEPRNAAHHAVIQGILREGIKRRFKDNESRDLGPLWQDYGAYCQLPDGRSQDFWFCRRFEASPKIVRGGRWVIQIPISTSVLDGRTVASYYEVGRANELADLIRARLERYSKRNSEPCEIRALHSDPRLGKASIVNIENPLRIIEHGTLPPKEQQKLVGLGIRCAAFKQPPQEINPRYLRLTIESEITEEAHSESIIEPEERARLSSSVRAFVQGAEIYRQTLSLATEPIDAAEFPGETIPPPALRVRSSDGKAAVLPSVTEVTESSLKARARGRAEHVKRYGFLMQRQINPLLAFPRHLGERRGERMLSDLNTMLDEQRIKYRFDLAVYSNIDELQREVESRGADAVLAVLPEGSRAPLSPSNTHEKIKQRLSVPSQCIQHDNTLHADLVDLALPSMSQTQAREWQRVRRKYEMSLQGLLVKCHWVPYAPAAAAFYHTQVGIDVGGIHNNSIMTCIGTGFGLPGEQLIYLPGEIYIDRQKVEPIPAAHLFSGLLTQFEKLQAELSQLDIPVSFNRVLFYRDGHLHRGSDGRNERDAIRQLHDALLAKGWLGRNAVWSVVEVLKLSSEWRLMRDVEGAENPLVGRVLYLTDDDNEALVWTTGSPYLTQGTARPLRVKLFNIIGEARMSDVLKDLVWQADCSYTKPDSGVSLPWPLYVADAGALAASRAHNLCGITV